jgi:hypothetical protein
MGMLYPDGARSQPLGVEMVSVNEGEGCGENGDDEAKE